MLATGVLPYSFINLVSLLNAPALALGLGHGGIVCPYLPRFAALRGLLPPRPSLSPVLQPAHLAGISFKETPIYACKAQTGVCPRRHSGTGMQLPVRTH